MSLKPVSGVLTSSSYANLAVASEDGKYSTTLNVTTQSTARSVGEMFRQTIESKRGEVPDSSLAVRPNLEQLLLFPIAQEDSSFKDSDNDHAVLIHRLNRCSLDSDLAFAPESSEVLDAYLCGYMPSSQDGMAQLYKQLRKAPSGRTPSQLPVVADVATARSSLKRTLSERVSLNPELTRSTLDIFSIQRQKQARLNLEASLKAAEGKKPRSRKDAGLDGSESRNPKKMHPNGVRGFGKRALPKD